MTDDETFLREAVRLARENLKSGGGGPFGAVVVKDGEIVGRGQNHVTTANDPTAHAEVVAIRDACRTLGTYTLKGCALYASCEPCPMCLGAIYWARLDRLVYGATREDAAKAGFDDDFLYKEVSLPAERRSLSTEARLRNESNAVLLEWIDKDDKTPY